jgi:hypothetical protein
MAPPPRRRAALLSLLAACVAAAAAAAPMAARAASVAASPHALLQLALVRFVDVSRFWVHRQLPRPARPLSP